MVVRITQVRAIGDRTTQQMELLFREKAAQLRARIAEKMVDSIVELSPVDTGTYIMAHSAATSDTGGAATRSSEGKPRGRSKSQFANLARGNLMRSVSARAIQASDTIYFRNSAIHARRVENIGWATQSPYHVYSQTRGKFGQFVREAASELGFQTR